MNNKKQTESVMKYEDMYEELCLFCELGEKYRGIRVGTIAGAYTDTDCFDSVDCQQAYRNYEIAVDDYNNCREDLLCFDEYLDECGLKEKWKELRNK